MKNTKKYKRIRRDVSAVKQDLAQMMRENAGTAARRSGAPIGIKGKADPGRKNPAGAKMDTNKIISGIFRGVEKATGKNLATDVLQHATTPQECKAWLQAVKGMYTSPEGTLDKEGYCNALNTVRDDMLFTIGELEKAIEDARREGNEKPVPGYETMITTYQTNAGILADEIQKNGGKVNN